MKLNLLKFLLAALGFLAICSPKNAFAAVPTLSYTPANNTYNVGTAITPLTPASSGVGTAGNYGTPANFGSGYSGPQDIAIDPSGNVYVTNVSNSTVRKFTSAGTFVSTLGTGLNQPYDMSFDASGNAYITNYAANTITKITSGGVQSTFISTGLTNPFGTSEDAAGNVYVANYNGGGAAGAILKYNSAGTLIQTITTPSPTNVAVDVNGNIYALSYGNGTVTEYNAAGVSQGSVGGFSSSFGVTLDASGNFYVADYANNRIAIYNSSATLINSVSTPNPTGVAVDASGNLYVSSSNSGTVLKYAPTGGFFINKPLPAGLIFNSSTGAISGTPTATSAATIYTITAYNTSGANTTTETITVTNPPLPVISYASPQTYKQGVAISTLSPNSTGGAVATYSATLPAGLVINASTGAITGTPTTVSLPTNYTVTATNVTGSSTATINITVNVGPPLYSYASPQIYTQFTAISALSPTSTGGTIVTYTATTALPAGLTLNTSTGIITGTPTTVSAATNYTITGTNVAGSSTAVVNITVNLAPPAIAYATPQTYTQGTAIATLSPTNTGGAVTSYSITGLPAGLTINASGAITGTPTSVSAATNYTVTATNAAGTSTATINITVNPAAPVISYATPQTYYQSTAIPTLSPTSTGGTVASYSASSLPAGLSINTATGAITGTPTTISAATNYTITATNATASTTATINITVKLALPAFSYPTPQAYAQNVAIPTLSPTSTGGAITTFTAPSLPSGLNINAVTGAITGTPTTVTAATNYTVTATNTSGSSTATINITVFGPPTVPSVTQCGAGAVLTASDSGPSGGTYNWYTAATGGVAFQSSTSTTFSAIATATYYVSYTYNGGTTARTSTTATINPIVSAPYSGAYFSYPFNGNTNDVSSYGNAGSNNGATLTTDRYGSANAAYSFNGTSNYIRDPFLDNNPSTYTVSIWFNTTTTTGGSLIGLESGNNDDRVLYMANSGQVYWGLYTGSVQTINTAASYNDGNWHHAIVTVSSAGSTLYLDGISQANSATMTVGNGTNGYWQMGYSNVSGWANPPSSNYFSGNLDDIAVYHRVLSTAEISSSNDLNQIFSGTATACTALTFNAPTITGATYTWKDPNNVTLTGQSVSFPGAVAGNYTLTVTGGTGGCSSTATITPVVYTSATATFNSVASVAVSTNTSISLYSPVASSTYSWNFGGGTSSSGTTGQGPFSVQWSTTGIKTITLTTTTSGGCVIVSTQTITVTSTTFGNYTYSRNITLNNAAVGMSANVSQFPVLLSIQNNDLIISGTCNDKILSPNGPNYDFAFFDSSLQSELYYQVESYNQTTGTLLVWVRIPTMYAATNNTLAFYYGAKVPSVTHDAAFSAHTWTADYQAVYHFNETAYSPTTADGTANNRTASLSGFGAGNYVANGKIGSCYTFGGVKDMEASATAPSTIVTTSAWINTSNNNIDEKVISDQNSSGEGSGGYKLAVYFGSVELEQAGNGNRVSTTPAEPGVANNTWYYITGVYDGTTMSTYINGVQYKTLSVSATTTFSNTLYIGIGEGKIYPFNGMIDEPRVSTVAKSTDWIKMEYADQNNPVAFTSVASSAASFSAVNGASTPGEISYTWTGATSTDPTVAANWNNTATGTTALPPFDGTQSLYIPGGLSKYPTLTSSISLYGLTMASGATLNLNGYMMSVGCHIYNGSGGQILYGTSSTAGGITFNGSLPTQYYYGTTTGIANVANITINNSGAGTVDITGGAVGISNSLTLTNGNLLIDNTNSGSLTLLSTATNSASVAAVPTGSSITGNVNVQRFITSGAGKRGYRLITSPVNVSSTVSGSGTLDLSYINTNATFNGTTFYGGFTAGPGTGFSYNGSPNPTMYLYDETRPTDNTTFVSGKNAGISTITGSSGSPAYSISALSGKPATTNSGVVVPTSTSYIWYFIGSNQSAVTAESRVPDATTLTATGYLNQGTIPFKFWKTGSTTMPYDVTTGTANYGMSQVGNPYASTISLNTLFTDNYIAASNAIGAAFYELIPGGNYVSYNASNGHVSDARASQYIVSGQGFVAQATGTGQTLTFKEDQKSTYSASSALLESFPSGGGKTTDALASNKSIPGNKKHTGVSTKLAPVGTNPTDSTGMHLQLTKDSANFAQTGIYFNSTASDKYVSIEDAIQIDGGTPLVFLSSYSSDSVKLSINTLADYGQGKRIRLYVNAITSGTYSISLANITDFDTSSYNVYLVDQLNRDSLDIVHNKPYSFTVNLADTTTFGSNRFVLAIDHKAVGQYLLTTFTGEKVTSGVQLNWNAQFAGNYTGYTLQKLNSSGGYDSLYSVQSDTSVTAYNFIDTHPIIGSNVYRLEQNGINGAITYSAIVTVGYNSTTPNGTLTLYPNPASSILNVNMTSSTINTPNYTATIYSSLGAKVSQQTVSGPTWTNDVSNYRLGVYVMQIKDTNGNIVATAKFVKVQ